MRCVQCQAELLPGDGFCGACGRPTGMKNVGSAPPAGAALPPLVAASTPPLEMTSSSLAPVADNPSNPSNPYAGYDQRVYNGPYGDPTPMGVPAIGRAPMPQPTMAAIGALSALAVVSVFVAIFALRSGSDDDRVAPITTDASDDTEAPATSATATVVESTVADTSVASSLIEPTPVSTVTSLDGAPSPATTAAPVELEESIVTAAPAPAPTPTPAPATPQVPIFVRESSNPNSFGFSNCLGGSTPEHSVFVHVRSVQPTELATAPAAFDAAYDQGFGPLVFVSENRFTGCVSIVPFKVSGCAAPVGDGGFNNPKPNTVAAALIGDDIVDPSEMRCPDGSTPTSTEPVYSMWVGPFVDAQAACRARDDIRSRRPALGLANDVNPYTRVATDEVLDFYAAIEGYSGYNDEPC